MLALRQRLWRRPQETMQLMFHSQILSPVRRPVAPHELLLTVKQLHRVLEVSCTEVILVSSHAAEPTASSDFVRTR